MRLRHPDIQKQLLYHMRARAAALRGLEAVQAGRRKEALASQLEARRWFRIYQEYGGKGPLT